MHAQIFNIYGQQYLKYAVSIKIYQLMKIYIIQILIFNKKKAIIIISGIEIGVSSLPALGVILSLLPVQIYLGRFKSKTGFDNTMTTSKRVHIMSEILTAIKLIKFYAWEMPFYERIVAIRQTELSLLRKNQEKKEEAILQIIL